MNPDHFARLWVRMAFMAVFVGIALAAVYP